MEPRAQVVPSKHNIFTHFPKDQNCDICLRTKITRAACRRRTGTVVSRAENFGDLLTADHKVLGEGCESRHNHRYAVVVQDLASQWIQSFPCEEKTSQETQKSWQKFLEPTKKAKVIYTDNSFEFGKACKELSWNHCTSTPHRSETNGIPERAVRRVKEGTSAVLLQSGLDEKWWADSIECFCYLRNIRDLLSDGKTPHERRFGVPSKKFFQSNAMLYVFEDNEAVIKMRIKDRSPTMRHVSRTHRVALDWSFDRSNLDPKIQIRYIDTKHQIADIFAKGNFTRDEWNNLLRLFNIIHFSSLCCAKNFSLISCTERMAKRMQEQKEENRIVAKSRPTAMTLVSSVPASSSSVNSPIASRSTGCTQSFKSNYYRDLVQAQIKLQSRRSVEFSKMA